MASITEDLNSLISFNLIIHSLVCLFAVMGSKGHRPFKCRRLGGRM